MTDTSSYPSTPVQSSARRPVGFARINGSQASILRFGITNKKHFAADEFSILMEPWQQPEGFGLDFWSSVSGDVQVEVLIGFLGPGDDWSQPPANATSLVLGIADRVDCDPLMTTLAVHGRDLTAPMIDTKFSNLWPDATASTIAQAIASNHGFQTNITSTSTPIGQYANTAYGAISLTTPEWDVLVNLAKQEGFDTYMTGNTLYFGPVQSDSSPVVIDLENSGQNQLVASTEHEVTLDRDLTRARPIMVKVLSHNVATQKTIIGKASGGNGSGTTQNYIKRIPNLTQAQADQAAQSFLADVVTHGMKVSALLPGDPTINAHRQVRVTGTNTAFDQTYYMLTVEHEWDVHRGYHTHIEARNSDPNNES